MRRLLLDANMPPGVRTLLPEYDVRTARQMGRDRLTNGDLLNLAENAGFEAMITADRNIRYQQNLVGRKIALIEQTTPHWETIRDNFAAVRAAPPKRRQAAIQSFHCRSRLGGGVHAAARSDMARTSR